MTQLDRSTPHRRVPWSLSLLSVLTAAAALGACGDAANIGGPSSDFDPDADPVVTAGRDAFLSDCASCHASRDGFDLAYFAFSDADIVRRALGHVDQPTAESIRAYIRSIDVPRFDRDLRPFQPAGAAAGDDRGFWRSVFGADHLPRGFTAQDLRAVDLTSVAVPLELPAWSTEQSDLDWMPDFPMPGRLLDASGGDLRQAIDAYYATGSLSSLVNAVEILNLLVGDSSPIANPPCGGFARTEVHNDARECFEARRWMSSLAAIHYLRAGQAVRDVPDPIAELWWGTGEVGSGLGSGIVEAQISVPWFYLGFIFQPEGFPQLDGYFETPAYMRVFAPALGFPRLYAFVALRRMVSSGPVQSGRPSARARDAMLAVQAAPTDLKVDVARFALEYLVQEYGGAGSPSNSEAVQVEGFANSLLNDALQKGSPTQAEDSELRSLRAELSAAL